MAGKFSVWMANRILNKAFRGEDFSVPASYYIALCKATDDVALRADVIASASEVTAVGYARLEVRGATLLNFTSSTDAITQVSGLLAWAGASAPWGTVTYGAVMDAATGGHVVVYGALASPKVVDSGDTFKIPVGLFTVAV